MGRPKPSETALNARAGVGLTAMLALLLAAASPTAMAQTAAQRPARPRPAPARPAQPADDQDDTPATVSELVVTGGRAPGAVIGDIKPEITLSPQQVQSYGVSTVTDLLTELAPQTSTGPGSGPPVILLNGRRISGFNEVRDIPTEAIQRVEILPQEVALKYGYSADQRVVNIVLRPFFRAVTAEATGGAPTAGGQVQGQAQLDVMRIRRDTRLNLALKAQDSTAITEDERDVVQPVSPVPFDPRGNVVGLVPGLQIDPALSALAGQAVTVAGVPQGVTGAPTLQDFAATANAPNVGDLGRYRTLQGASRSASANLVYTQPIFAGIQATVNGTFEATHSDSLQGLPGVTLEVPAGSPFSPFTTPVAVAWDVTRFGPLKQTTDGWTGHLGTTLNRDLGKWRFTVNSAYDHADSQTRTDAGVDASSLQQRLNALDPTFNPFAPIDASLTGALLRNLAHSRTDTASADALATGPLFSLPAGALNLSLHVGDTQSWFNSRSTLFGQDQSIGLKRNDLNGRINLDAPILKAHDGWLDVLGDLTVNGNAAIDRLSDFGTLTSYGYGGNWRPTSWAAVILSHTRDQAAPSFQQSGGPIVVTPGARVFDFTTGQTVDVNLVTGGNPDLTSTRRDVTRLGTFIRPWPNHDLTIQANYTHTFTRNPIATFPAATAQIQAVFPDRFVRDPEGDLDEVDYRPVNFASETKSELRWGINFSMPFGKPPPPPSREEIELLRKRFAGRIQQFQRQRAAQGQTAAGQNATGQGAQAQGGPAAAPNGQPANGQAPAAAPDGAPPAFFGPGGGGPPGGGPGGGFGGPPGGGGFGGPGGGFGGPPGGGFFGGGGGGARGARPASGRLQLALYHTITFDDSILVRPGGPVFDLLNGYPSGSGGGQPRHHIEAQAGVTWRGMGARLSGNWQSGTFISGDGSPVGALTFSPLTTLDLRLFADFAQQRTLMLHHPWLAGTRVTLSVTNILDAHQRVRDATGATPVTYQPAYLDPVGRVVRLNVRKLFF